MKAITALHDGSHTDVVLRKFTSPVRTSMLTLVLAPWIAAGILLVGLMALRNTLSTVLHWTSSGGRHISRFAQGYLTRPRITNALTGCILLVALAVLAQWDPFAEDANALNNDLVWQLRGTNFEAASRLSCPGTNIYRPVILVATPR